MITGHSVDNDDLSNSTNFETNPEYLTILNNKLYYTSIDGSQLLYTILKLLQVAIQSIL